MSSLGAWFELRRELSSATPHWADSPFRMRS